MFWFFYILFELFIWNPHVRYFLIGDHPILQMSISVLNDAIWLLPALALPIYSVLLIRRVFLRLILRDSILFIFLICWIISIVTIDIFFRLQFMYMLFFLSLWIAHILQTRTVSLRISFFALALFGIIFHYNSQLIPLPRHNGASNISVLSFNFNTKAAFDDERTIHFIRRRVPDVVFLQELTHREHKFITSKLSDLYPYFVAPARKFGKNDVMILSRKKIVYGDHIRLQTTQDQRYHSANHAVIDFNGQYIHLLNCHLRHAYKPFTAYLSDQDSTELYDELKISYKTQQEEARLLADYALSLQGPVIIAGDFNDTPNSMIYAMFNKHYKNAYASAGWGLGTTFGEWAMKKKLPRLWRSFSFDILRIDHVFFSKEFKIKSAKVEKISAFDHRPYSVTAILKEE